MSCDEIRPLLSALVRGDLGPAEASRARAHAAGCEGCGKELRELEAVEERLAGWEADPGPADVWPAVEARLPRAGGGWGRVSLAAAVLLAALAVVFHVAGPRNREQDPIRIEPGPGVLEAKVPEDRAVARHAELAAARTPMRVSYVYVGAYDEALNAGSYSEFSDRVAAAAPESQADSGAGLLVPPAYVPRGSKLQRVEPAIATAEAAWSTPFGDLTVLQEKGGQDREGFVTVVGGGREIKLSRFSSGDVQVTLVGEGVPWPEMDRIGEGFFKK